MADVSRLWPRSQVMAEPSRAKENIMMASSNGEIHHIHDEIPSADDISMETTSEVTSSEHHPMLTTMLMDNISLEMLDLTPQVFDNVDPADYILAETPCYLLPEDRRITVQVTRMESPPEDDCIPDLAEDVLNPSYSAVFTELQLLLDGEDFAMSVEAVLNKIMEELPFMDNDVKLSVCIVLPALSGRIADYLTQCDKMGEPPVFIRATVLKKLCDIFQAILLTWLQRADLELKQAVLSSAGYMCFCLRSDDLEAIFPRVIKGILVEYCTVLDPIHITRCISRMLNAVKVAGIKTQDSWFKTLYPALLHQVYVTINESRPFSLENKTTAEVCFTSLAQLSLPPVLEFLYQMLDSREDVKCLSAVCVLQQLNGPDSPHLPQFISFVRLLIIAAIGKHQADQCAALRFLMHLGPTIHPSLGPVVMEHMPALPENLPDECPFCQKKWEYTIIKFIALSVNAIDDDTWNNELMKEVKRKCYRCFTSPQDQAFLYMFYGIIVQASHNTAFVIEHLQFVLQQADFEKIEDREGVATAVGLAAQEHQQCTLTMIHRFAMGAIATKPMPENEQLRQRAWNIEKWKLCTAMLCLGNVAAHAKEVLVISPTILYRLMLYYVKGSKCDGNTFAFLKSMRMVISAVKKSSDDRTFGFSQKPKMMRILTLIIKTQTIGRVLRNSMCRDAMLGIVNLCKMQPNSSEEEKDDVLRVLIPFMCSLPPPDEESRTSASGIQTLHKDTQRAFHSVLTYFIQETSTADGLDIVMQHLQPFLTTENPQQCENALEMYHQLLEWSLQQRRPNVYYKGHEVARYIGLILPQTNSPNVGIQKKALECCFYGLQIQQCQKGYSLQEARERVSLLQNLRTDSSTWDNADFLTAGSKVAELVRAYFSLSQIGEFCLALLDANPSASTSVLEVAAALLHSAIKINISRLSIKVPQMIEKIHAMLGNIKSDEMQEDLQGVISLLVSSYPKESLSGLFNLPQPLDSAAVIMCKTYISEKVDLINFLPKILWQFEEKLLKIPKYPAMAIEVLSLLLPELDTNSYIRWYYPEILVKVGIFITHVAAIKPVDIPPAGQDPSIPRRCAISALKTAMIQAGFESEVVEMERNGGWQQIGSRDGHLKGLLQLARAILSSQNWTKKMIMEQLKPFLQSHLPEAAVFSQAFYIESCKLKPVIAHVHVIMTMMNEPEEEIALEAIETLSAVLRKMWTKEASRLCPAVALRARWLYKRESLHLRRASLAVFMQLLPLITNGNWDLVQAQIIDILVPVMQDQYNEDDLMREAATNAMRELYDLMERRENGGTFCMPRRQRPLLETSIIFRRARDTAMLSRSPSKEKNNA